MFCFFLLFFFSESIKNFFYDISIRLLSRYIIYTKIFQWFGIDDFKYVPSFVSDFLKSFTNKAPYVLEDIDFEEIINLYNFANAHNKKLTINSTPINSGTISIVFEGFYEEEKIAIKLLRVGIREKIDEAIKSINFIIYLFSFIPFLNKLSISETFQDVIYVIKSQTDFNKETENINLLYKSLKNYSLSETFSTIKELTTEKALCMKFVYGKTIYNLNEEEKLDYSNIFIKVNSFLNFKKSVYHLDIHPGNILFVEKDGKRKICLLDAGMICKLNILEQDFLYDFFKTVCSNSSDDEGKEYVEIVTKYIDEIFRYEKSKKEEYIVNIKSFFSVNKIFQIKKPKNIAKDLINLIIFCKENKMVVTENFSRIFLGFISFLGTFSMLDVDGKYLTKIGEHIKNF